MSRRLIVFSDMDGTFVTTEKSVPPENLRALDALHAAGGVFVPCSGRPVAHIPRELLEHPATRYAVAANGAEAYVVEHDAPCDGGTPGMRLGERVISHPLGSARGKSLVDALSAYPDVTFDAFDSDHAHDMRSDYDRLDDYMTPVEARFVRSLREPHDGMGIRQIMDEHPVVRITVFYQDPDVPRVAAAWSAANGVSLVSAMHNELEFCDEHATKGEALLEVCRLAGFPVSDSVAFGDSLNDVAMLRAAGDGVAMANSTQPALDAADHVTHLDNDHAGLGVHLMGLLARC